MKFRSNPVCNGKDVTCMIKCYWENLWQTVLEDNAYDIQSKYKANSNLKIAKLKSLPEQDMASSLTFSN